LYVLRERQHGSCNLGATAARKRAAVYLFAYGPVRFVFPSGGNSAVPIVLTRGIARNRQLALSLGGDP